MMRRWTLLLAATALSGCATFHQADQISAQATAAATAAQHNFPKTVDSTAAPYLLGPAVQLSPPLPPVLTQQVTLIGVHEPLRFIAAQLSQEAGVPVDVDLTAQDGGDTSLPMSTSGPSTGGLPPPPAALLNASIAGPRSRSEPYITIHFTGPVDRAADFIADQAGIYWKDDNGTIRFFDQEAKTFIMPALNRQTTSVTEINASGITSSNSESASGVTGGAEGTTTGGTSGGSNSGGSIITTSSTEDVWKGLEATAKIVAAGAQISADPQTGTLTVVGTPDQVFQVSNWVKSISRTLTETVAVNIQVYNVQLTNEDNYGVNPTIAFENSAKTFGFNVSGVSVPAVQGSATPFKFGASILSSATGTAGEFGGTNGAVQALSTLGKVTTIFSREVYTLNGQVSPIQSGLNTGYLQSSGLSQAANVGTTSSLEGGNIPTGFVGTVTPLVDGNNILLSVDVNMSSLISLITETSGEGSIQVPSTSQTIIPTTAAIRNGSSLMITGYQEANESETHNGVGSPYLPLLGGGGDAQVTRNLIAIVVTAEVVQ
jgi:type IVB pilus formation R64 PilN family outer membrane protein